LSLSFVEDTDKSEDKRSGRRQLSSALHEIASPHNANVRDRVEEISKRVIDVYVVANNYHLRKAGVNALQLKSMIEHRKVIAPAQLFGAATAVCDEMAHGAARTGALGVLRATRSQGGLSLSSST
jgi:hypothetical protein